MNTWPRDLDARAAADMRGKLPELTHTMLAHWVKRATEAEAKVTELQAQLDVRIEAAKQQSQRLRYERTKLKNRDARIAALEELLSEAREVNRG